MGATAEDSAIITYLRWFWMGVCIPIVVIAIYGFGVSLIWVFRRSAVAGTRLAAGEIDWPVVGLLLMSVAAATIARQSGAHRRQAEQALR